MLTIILVFGILFGLFWWAYRYFHRMLGEMNREERQRLEDASEKL